MHYNAGHTYVHTLQCTGEVTIATMYLQFCIFLLRLLTLSVLMYIGPIMLQHTYMYIIVQKLMNLQFRMEIGNP